jgi:hypothetical protein
MGDGSLQSHSGANLGPKTAKDRSNVPKGGEAGGVALTRTSFAVTSLGKQDIILGFTWLQEHNPEINWQTRKVLMSCCPDKCRMCRLEV